MEILKVPFALIAEWICFLASILFLLKTIPKFWRLFVPYLAITVTVESFSFYMGKISGHTYANQWAYNIFLLVYISFHLYIFSKLIHLDFIKKIIFSMFLILLGSFIWDLYHLGFEKFFSTTNALFGGGIVILAIAYYYALFKQDEFINIFKEPAFWFVSGCLIFYATATGTNAFFDEIVALSKKNNFPIRYVIMNILNIIMYGCWIKAFLCLQKKQRYLHQSY